MSSDDFTPAHDGPTPVEARRAPGAPPADELEADLERMRRLARLLDAQFTIAGVRVGWDSILGLIPAVGDVATALVGTYPILLARKHKLGRAAQLRMAANLLVDWAVGTVPVAGDAFDVVFKAHLRNLKILERAADKRRAAE